MSSGPSCSTASLDSNRRQPSPTPLRASQHPGGSLAVEVRKESARVRKLDKDPKPRRGDPKPKAPTTRSPASLERLVRVDEIKTRCPRCKEDVVLVFKVQGDLLVVVGVSMALEEGKKPSVDDVPSFLARGLRSVGATTRLRLFASRPKPRPNQAAVSPRLVCPRCRHGVVVVVKIDRTLAMLMDEVRHVRHPRPRPAPAAVRVKEGTRSFVTLAAFSLALPTRRSDRS